MHRIAAHRARDRFTGLLREVERGQAFAIERDGVVVAHLVPARTPPFRGLPPHAGALAASEPADVDAPDLAGGTAHAAPAPRRRPLGMDRGALVVPDDFDAPLATDVRDDLDGGDSQG